MKRSASELEYHIVLAGDLGFIKSDDTNRLSEDLIEVKKMLAAFLRKLNADR
jgi:four helix bundle protein